jgi:hypothetical protein
MKEVYAMAEIPDPPSNPAAEDGTRNSLETEQIRWEIDKLNAKRRLVEEVVQLVQLDRAVNSSVTRLVETMTIHAERDPAAFWQDRTGSGSAQGRFQFPLPPFPPFPPFGFPIPPPPLPFPFPFPPPPPSPGDVFGQVIDLIKSEKAMIQDLVTKLLT